MRKLLFAIKDKVISGQREMASGKTNGNNTPVTSSDCEGGFVSSPGSCGGQSYLHTTGFSGDSVDFFFEISNCFGVDSRVCPYTLGKFKLSVQDIHCDCLVAQCFCILDSHVTFNQKRAI